jgi:hypothetical protein
MTSSLVPTLGLRRAGEARCASDERRARARFDAEGPKGFARPFALRPFINRSNGTSDGWRASDDPEPEGRRASERTFRRIVDARPSQVASVTASRPGVRGAPQREPPTEADAHRMPSDMPPQRLRRRVGHPRGHGHAPHVTRYPLAPLWFFAQRALSRHFHDDPERFVAALDGPEAPRVVADLWSWALSAAKGPTPCGRGILRFRGTLVRQRNRPADR